MPKPSLLLSVRPEFAEKVFAGKKTVELRRTKPRVRRGDCVFVYASSPVKSIVGFFEVRKVIKVDLPVLWERVSARAGVTREQFDAYYVGASEGCGIFISKRWRFEEPLALTTLRERFGEFRPPQSYYYLAPNQAQEILRLGRSGPLRE